MIVFSLHLLCRDIFWSLPNPTPSRPSKIKWFIPYIIFLTGSRKTGNIRSQPRPQGFSLKKWVGWAGVAPHPFFEGKALWTRLIRSQFCKSIFQFQTFQGKKEDFLKIMNWREIDFSSLFILEVSFEFNEWPQEPISTTRHYKSESSQAQLEFGITYVRFVLHAEGVPFQGGPQACSPGTISKFRSSER